MLNLIKNSKIVLVMIKTLPLCIVLFVFFLFGVSCNVSEVKYEPSGYDFDNPIKYSLGTKLNEISGICWVSDSIMVANDDETGKIYVINLKNMEDLTYRSVKFGEKGDYEDIVKVDSAIYLLVSTGSIVKVTGYRSQNTVGYEELAVLEGKSNEFETLYYDKEINSLIMLCKKCHKEKNQYRTAYRFDLATQTLIDTPYYRIDMERIKKVTKDADPEFNPSAAAINPVDGKVYMVSPIGNLMVITDRKGKVETAFKISSYTFPQPEGITFAPNGDMYISNEIMNEPTATLLKFKYKKPNAKKQTTSAN